MRCVRYGGKLFIGSSFSLVTAIPYSFSLALNCVHRCRPARAATHSFALIPNAYKNGPEVACLFFVRFWLNNPDNVATNGGARTTNGGARTPACKSPIVCYSLSWLKLFGCVWLPASELGNWSTAHASLSFPLNLTWILALVCLVLAHSKFSAVL